MRKRLPEESILISPTSATKLFAFYLKSLEANGFNYERLTVYSVLGRDFEYWNDVYAENEEKLVTRVSNAQQVFESAQRAFARWVTMYMLGQEPFMGRQYLDCTELRRLAWAIASVLSEAGVEVPNRLIKYGKKIER